MESTLISTTQKSTAAKKAKVAAANKRAKASPKDSSQASRDDWIRTALLRLSREGMRGITIDALCQELSLTKGSFYWHFKNRQELLLAMADSYAENTAKVYAHARNSGLSDADQIKQTGSKSVAQEWGNVDRAMRIWAQTCEDTAIAVKKADQSMLNFLEEKFTNLGVAPENIAALARMTLATSVGAFAISPNIGEQVFEDTNTLIFRLIESMTER